MLRAAGPSRRHLVGARAAHTHAGGTRCVELRWRSTCWHPGQQARLCRTLRRAGAASGHAALLCLSRHMTRVHTFACMAGDMRTYAPLYLPTPPPCPASATACACMPLRVCCRCLRMHALARLLPLLAHACPCASVAAACACMPLRACCCSSVPRHWYSGPDAWKGMSIGCEVAWLGARLTLEGHSVERERLVGSPGVGSLGVPCIRAWQRASELALPVAAGSMGKSKAGPRQAPLRRLLLCDCSPHVLPNQSTARSAWRCPAREAERRPHAAPLKGVAW